MNSSPTAAKCCHCDQAQQQPTPKSSPAKAMAKTLSSALLSILIAFFPKCPMCWAVYMSMFGSIGLAQLPYMRWLLPVLLFFLAFHLYMLYRKSAMNGYSSFIVSLAGTALLLTGRLLLPAEKWLIIAGMILIISGSLLNSFFSMRTRALLYKNNN